MRGAFCFSEIGLITNLWTLKLIWIELTKQNRIFCGLQLSLRLYLELVHHLCHFL